MSRLTTDERTKLVGWYFENHKSVVNTQRAYKRNFKTRDAPTSRTIREVVKRFQEKGTVAYRERCGPPKSVRTPQNIEVEGKNTRFSPTIIKNLARQLKFSRRTVRRILTEDLNLYSYKIQILQAQTVDQKNKRLEFVQMMADKIEDREIDITKIHWFDEAHFHLSGHVNTHNMRIWAEKQPFPATDKVLSREKVTVWCAVAHNRIIDHI